jgi:hypothetical protein
VTREPSNRLSRLPKQLEAKFADVSSVLRSSGEVRASPLAFPPHFKPANSSAFNLTVKQMSIRMDVLETSIQDCVNVDFPLSPPGGIPNHAAVPWNFPCQWLRVDEVLVGVSLWPGGCVLSTSAGEFSHALGQWPDFPVGHVPLATPPPQMDRYRLFCCGFYSGRQSYALRRKHERFARGCLSTNGFPLPGRLSRAVGRPRS